MFKLFDTRGLSRIDGMEVLCCMAMASSGSLVRKLELCFYAFGMNEQAVLGKSEFCFFLDSYCRGIGKVVLRKIDTFYPKEPNIRLRQEAIEGYANLLFTSSVIKISAQDFLLFLEKESGALKKIFTIYPEEFQRSQEIYRETMTNRIRLIPFIKSLIYGMLPDTKPKQV